MTKSYISIFALVLTVFSALFTITTPAAAQDLPKVSLLIIDFERVSTDSRVGQDITAQIQQHASKINTWQSNIEAALNGERQELERQQTIIAPDAFEQMALAFQQKANGANNQLQSLRENLRNVGGQAQLEIDRVLKPIVNTFMAEKGATVVMDKRVVWLSAGGFDLTTQVIERLNNELPGYKMTFMAVPTIQ